MCAQVLEHLVDPLATLLAAFAGAWFAFRFERRSRTDDETERQVGAANRALYTIFNIWNIQAQLRKEIVDPFRNKPDAWLNMAATVPAHYGVTRFEADSLGFLLGTHSELFAELFLEEQRFALAVHMVEARSRIILGEVFPRLSAAGVGIGEQRFAHQIEGILGAGITQQLRVLAAGITSNVDENMASLESLYVRFRTAMVERYPKEKFIRLEFTKNDAAPTAA